VAGRGVGKSIELRGESVCKDEDDDILITCFLAALAIRHRIRSKLC
jgi:hypothetical protein